jgi:heterodisulfide reductase subunit C
MEIVNFTFRKELLIENASLSYCYQCATCSGGCPVALKTGGDYNPRKIIEFALLGLEERLIKGQSPNIWLCSTCQKCVEYCPQKVFLTEIFTILKNKAAARGKAPPAFYIQGKSILDAGMAITITPPILRRREQLKLPVVEMARPDEIQKLLKETKFPNILQAQEKEGGPTGASEGGVK